MTAKAPSRDLFPLLRPYFSAWLVEAATGAYLSTSVATSPTWSASASPSSALNPTTGDALAPGSIVSGTDGVLYVADSTGAPKAQASTGVAQTWSAAQTIPDAYLLIVDPSDATKRARLDAGHVTAGATRVVALPDHNAGMVGLVYASTTASTAITGATEVDTAFDTNFIFGASTLRAGMTVRIQGWGICTATTGAETHQILIKFGSVTVLTQSSINPANNEIWFFDVTVTLRTVGASGTLVASGIIGNGASGTATGVLQITASSSIDTTAAILVSCNIDRQASATDSDSARLEQLTVTVGSALAA